VHLSVRRVAKAVARTALAVKVVALGALLVALTATMAYAQVSGDDSANAAHPSPMTEPLEQPRARVHFEAGRNHFEVGAYEEAAREFAAAHELSGRPELLYNMYLAHERAGNVEAAAHHLERYLHEVSVPEDVATALHRRLENLQARAEQQRAAQAVPPAPAEAPPYRLPSGAIAAFITAGAGLAAFAVFAGLSEAENRRLAGSCGADVGAFCTDSEVSRLRAYNLVADVGLAVGLVGAAVGLAWWLLSRRAHGRESSVSLAARAPGGTGGVTLGVRF
jgi:tetratricopeptide (TPR) repeat protein